MLLRKYYILQILFLLFAIIISSLLPAHAEDIGSVATAEIQSLIDNGGFAFKKNNKYIVTHNLHTPYVPASIVKIATALAALDSLGPSFRFETFFYRDDLDNLYIKGLGDPFLISEEVVIIVERLKELGCTKINNIYLDNTAFSLKKITDGSGLSDNPYDAQNSALAVNFNTVNIEKDSIGRVISAEEQTPILPLMTELAEGLEPGVHRINITQDKNTGDAIINRYVGELFRAFQKKHDISGQGKVVAKKTPKNLEPFYIHRSSKTLEDIVGPLMLYSNNFIANQLFLTLGVSKFGYPATWEKSILAMAVYLRSQYNLSQKEVNVVEGSGLSRKNRASPHAMIQLLDSFKYYAKDLPYEEGRLLKSGTLKGVYTYGGYLIENENLDSFVLLLNQKKNNRDRLLDVLEKIYRAN
ncbi:MAG: D-alanyl-D-alanine carboxypeptidase [Deltaproteobacteria bacterium]|nr:MAG: D-alanyl-D-alanine carboxypeptidase [Deltaproteobacteria bacterium]